MKSNNCIIIAHRGESYDAPENTLASINLAWERNADAVEIDVQLSKDNKIVVIHDENTKRIWGRNKPVREQTLRELKELNSGFYKNKEWEGEKIPVFSEVLATVPPQKKLVVELKCGPEIVEILKEEIDSSGLKEEQIEIISFDISTVAKAKQVLPEHKILFLSGLNSSFLGKLSPPSVDKLVLKVLENQLDGLDVWAGNMIDEKFMQKIKSNRLMLYVWTVNDSEKAKKLKSIGVDGITTDRAQWLRENISSG